MGPLIPLDVISPQWNQVFALLLGIAFGFVMEASGFSSTRKMMGTFFGYDFIVLRVFFTASITAMIGLLYFDYVGWIDYSLLYTNPLYIGGAIIGGVIMGIGFATGGYCPGTSYCAAAIGKIDAWVFSIGLFLGILIFSEIYPLIEPFYKSYEVGPSKLYEVLGIPAALLVFIIAVLAIGIFYAASMVRRRVKKVEY